jgi:hypothetical protein
MSTLTIFILGIITAFLCIFFVVFTLKELKKLGEEAERKLKE